MRFLPLQKTNVISRLLARPVMLGLLLVPSLIASCFARSAYADNWALLIGIDHYEDGAESAGRIPPLAGAVNDANAIAGVLTERAGFPKENVFVLTSSSMTKPTRSEILGTLTTLSERVHKGDTVFVFYAGHGCFDSATGKDYLMPYDTKTKAINLLKNTALDTDTFLESLHNLPAKLLVVAFDKCRVEIGRGGTVAEPDSTQEGRALNFRHAAVENSETEADANSPQVVVKWFACSPNQRSYEWQDKSRGYFSYFLEQGLRGAAAPVNGGPVTMADLARYVGPAVQSQVQQIEGQEQSPRLLLDNVASPDELSSFVLVANSTGGGALVDTKARLTLDINAPNAIITVDGKPLQGKTYTADLPTEAATVNVKIMADGYKGKLLTINLRRGKTVTVPVTLTSLNAPVSALGAMTAHEDFTCEQGQGEWIGSVAYSPDGKHIVTGSFDHTAKIWDAETHAELHTLTGHNSDILAVAYSPDGKWIATGSRDRTAKIWDAVTGVELLTLKGQGKEVAHEKDVTTVAFSPDSKFVATGSMDKTAKIWDATTGAEISTLDGHKDAILSIAFSPDGSRIVTGSWDNIVKIWNAQTGAVALTIKGHKDRVTSVAFSPDGKRIVTGSDDGTAKTWDSATGNELVTFEGHGSWLTSVAFSPDGKRIITGSGDRTAKIWDAETGKEIVTLTSHTGTVTSVEFAPDGHHVLTGSTDGTAKVWTLQQPTASQ